jgi:hypothetical protein
LKAAAIVLVGAVVACGGPAVIDPTTAVSPSQPAGTIEANPGLVATAELKDKTGDVHDLEWRAVSRAPHVDIVKVTAAADGHNLRVVVYFAGDVPAKLSSFKEEINYSIDMTVNDSGDIDYSVQFGNHEGGNWDASLIPWFDVAAEEYPAPIVDGSVGFVVPLSSLGNATAIRLSVTAQRVDHADGSVVAEDDARWLRLGG